MFDVSFGELILIGAVTLIVVGPERMPKVARTAGMLLGRLQRFIGNVKAELHQEMQMSELAQLEADLRKEADEIQQSIHQPLSDAASMLAEGAQMPPTASEENRVDESSAAIAANPNEHGQLDLFANAVQPLNSAYRDRR
ncbi:Sec-independent protein translocase protein TatB [Deefgea tanakiae]|uniref:Sec-independent protein translocase protein TatB n=1 Tax=Deefgea tanakiae TaxID=2865840 RepID=A0ABX8Z7S6_9NEIS|nr:Sec-independent protein translocase protein TatB [Deefgea tanakiae]QZA77205.1 Sec-independent protein translocase protein TatB [Deefgea tanakiae]